MLEVSVNLYEGELVRSLNFISSSAIRYQSFDEANRKTICRQNIRLQKSFKLHPDMLLVYSTKKVLNIL